jgi:drug/metabolite transporter (DMT)-like permease
MITRGKNNGQLSRRDLVGGVVLGIVAMLLTAAGIVLVKPYLKETSLLWACFSRMAGGAVSTSLLLAGHPRRRTIVAPLRSGAKRGLLVFASILAAYFSQFFWLGGMKYTQASTASALNQVNTIFIFLLAALFLKEKITPLKLVAVGLAFGGAILVSAPF